MLGKITPFVHNTFKIVNESTTNDIISWNPRGDAFIVKDQYRFQSDVLPRYFKHNNLSSFIRQLNTYQFHKVPLDDLDYPVSGESIIFAHPQFIRGREDLLPNIVRRSKRNSDPQPNNYSPPAPMISPVMNNPPDTFFRTPAPLTHFDAASIPPEIMAKQVVHMYNRLEETNNLLLTVHNELLETKDMLFQLQQSQTRSPNRPHLAPIQPPNESPHHSYY